MEEATGARLMYLLDWSLTPKASITFWEVHSIFYDAMNRFAWIETNNNAPRAGESKELQPGVVHQTSRMSWWKLRETENLGRWVSCVVFVGAARMKDGAVWSYDKSALVPEMNRLSFDPSEVSLLRANNPQ